MEKIEYLKLQKEFYEKEIQRIEKEIEENSGIKLKTNFDSWLIDSDFTILNGFLSNFMSESVFRFESEELAEKALEVIKPHSLLLRIQYTMYGEIWEPKQGEFHYYFIPGSIKFYPRFHHLQNAVYFKTLGDAEKALKTLERLMK